MTHYWIETAHGVVVDVVNDVKMARKVVRENNPFRSVPRRAFFHNEKGQKVYVKENQDEADKISVLWD